MKAPTPKNSPNIPLLRVWIVEDHAAIRELLQDFLAELPSVKVVGAGDTAEPAIAAARAGQVDLVVLDLMLRQSGGLAALPEFSALSPAPKILVFTAATTLQTVEVCVRHGVSGYVEKDASLDRLQEAIDHIRQGKVYFTEGANGILRQLVTRRSNARPELVLDERTLALLRLIAKGLPMKSVARELGVSRPYTYRLRQELLRKLNVRSDQEAALAALSMGLLDLPGAAGQPSSDSAES